jgi:hypothetical protein
VSFNAELFKLLPGESLENGRAFELKHTCTQRKFVVALTNSLICPFLARGASLERASERDAYLPLRGKLITI